MTQEKSDALVFFGATGDLAYKKIFPALQAMVRHGDLDMPVIGVAKAGWNLEQFRERAQDEPCRSMAAIDEAAFAKLSARLRYVDGDYDDPATLQPVAQAHLGRRAAAAALPGDPAQPVRDRGRGAGPGGLRRGRARGGGKAVRPRPGFGPRAEPHRCTSTFPSRRIFRIDHYLGKEPVLNLLYFRFANPHPRADLEPPLPRLRADHDGRELRRPGSRQVLRRGRRDPRRRAEPHAAGRGLPGHGAARRQRRRGDSRREGQGPAGRCGRSTPRRHRARPVPRLPRRARRGPGLARSRRSPPCGFSIDNWRWAGVPFYVRVGKCLPVTSTEVLVILKTSAADGARRIGADLVELPALPAQSRGGAGAVDRGPRCPAREMGGEEVELVAQHKAPKIANRTSGCSAMHSRETRRSLRGRTRSRQPGGSSILCWET